jgi:hypothetical protein
MKNNRIFLKRTEVSTVTLSDFFIGGTVTVLARLLKVEDYADCFTRKELEVTKGR